MDSVSSILGLIFTQTIFLHLLIFLIGIPSAVTHAYPGIFPFIFNLLEEIPSAFLGELRDNQADHLSVVARGDSHV